MSYFKFKMVVFHNYTFNLKHKKIIQTPNLLTLVFNSV